MLPIALCNRGGEVGLQDEGLARHFAVSGYAFQREAVLRERKCLIWLAIALHDFVQPRHHPAHDCSPVARAAIRAAASVRSEERRVGKECVRRVDLGGRRIIKKKRNMTHIKISRSDDNTKKNQKKPTNQKT